MKIFKLTMLACLLMCPSVFAGDKDSYLSFMKGLVLENDGKYTQALDEYRSTIERDPNAFYVYSHAARLAMRTGKFDEAEKWCKKLVEVDPSKAENWTLMGGLNWAKGNIEEAGKAYEKALSIDPHYSLALQQLAGMYASKDPDRALGYMERYLVDNPDDKAMVFYQMGLIYYQKGDTQKAEEKLQAAVKAEPDFMQPKLVLGQVYEGLGKLQEALEVFTDAARLDPKNTALLVHIGEIYGSMKKLPEAEVYFRKAKKLDGGNPTANFWLSAIAEKDKDFAAAVRYVQDSSLYETEPSLWLRASYYLTQDGKYKDAVRLLADAYKKWPDNYEIGYFYSLGLDDTGETSKAMSILKDIVTAKPDYKEARIRYAILCEKADRVAEAEEHFKAVLKDDPDNVMILNYIGYMLADRGLRLPEAEQYLTKAISLAPENPACLDSLGWLHFKQGKIDKALEELKKSETLDWEDDTVWEHLGFAYYASGQAQKAWYCFKISDSYKPGRRIVTDKLASIERDLTEKELAVLYMKYLSAVSGAYSRFESLCKVTAKAGGREMSFDGIFSYKENGDLFMDILGPMFSPVWKMKISAPDGKQRHVTSEAIDFMGERGAALKPYAEDIVGLMWDFFAGTGLSAAPKGELKLTKSYLRSGNLTMGLEEKSRISYLAREKGAVKLQLKSYHVRFGRFIPGEVVVPGSIELTIQFTKPDFDFKSKSIPLP